MPYEAHAPCTLVSRLAGALSGSGRFPSHLIHVTPPPAIETTLDMDHSTPYNPSFGFVGNRNALHSRFNAVPALRPFGVRRGRPPAVCGPPCAATSCHSKLFGSISFVSFSFPLDSDLILHATPCTNALKLLDAHGPVEPARVQARCTLKNNDTSLHARAVG